MSKLWIVHRSPQVRAALLRATGLTAAEVASGAPAFVDFSSATVPAAIVLALSTDCEPELEFALRVGPRVRGARWILLCSASAKQEVRRIFRAYDPVLLDYPPDPRALRAEISAALAGRTIPSLAQRRIDERTAERFAAWFGATFVPGLEHALDPALASPPAPRAWATRQWPLSVSPARRDHPRRRGGGAANRRPRSDGPGRPRDAPRHRPGSRRHPRSNALARRGRRALLHGAARPRRMDPPRVAPQPGRLRCQLGTASLDRDCGPRRSRGSPGTGPLPGFRAARRERSPPRSAQWRALAHGRVRRTRVGPAGRRPAARLRPERPRGPRRGALVGRPQRGRGRPALDSRELTTRSDRSLGPALPRRARRCDRVRRDSRRAPDEPGTFRRPASFGTLPTDPVLDPSTELAAHSERWIAEQPGATGVPRIQRPQSPRPEAAVPGADPSWRKLARSLSHEIRNPLVSIRTFTELLPEHYADETFRARFKELVGKDVAHIQGVVSLLSKVAERERLIPEPVDVSALIDRLLAARRDRIGRSRLVVLSELERDEPEALADADALETALTGLVDRALDSLPERGDLFIATHRLANSGDGRPRLRVLLRHHNPQAEGMGGELDPVHHILEYVLAETLIAALGGRLTIDPTQGPQTLIVIDLPTPEPTPDATTEPLPGPP